MIEKCQKNITIIIPRTKDLVAQNVAISCVVAAFSPAECLSGALGLI